MPYKDIEAKRAASIRWRKANPNYMKNYWKRLWAEDPVKAASYFKKYKVLNRDKINARQKRYRAARDSKLIPDKKCEECLVVTDLQAHHANYANPLDVTWLCRQCHEKIHHH